MDGWPRIPHPGGGSGKAPRTTGTSLPAPGSTVVASVEDELGDGMYSLRWAGQKIHVSSKSPLAKGQALLLKSETSAEGKPRLVVLGPAPEQNVPSGRIIYGPNIGKKQPAEQLLQQQAAVQQQVRNAGLSHSRIGGNIVDTNSRAGRPDTGAAAGQAGGQMAAGVSKAVTIRAGDMMPGLIGLVLEPLPEFDLSAKRLLAAAKEEKQQLEDQQAAESGEAGEGEPDGEANAAEEAKKNRKDLLRPALPGLTGQAGKPGAGGAAVGASAGAGQARTPGQPPGASTAGQTAGQSPGASGQAPGQTPPQPPNAVAPGPVRTGGQPSGTLTAGQAQTQPGGMPAPGQTTPPPQQPAAPSQPGSPPSAQQNSPAQAGTPPSAQSNPSQAGSAPAAPPNPVSPPSASPTAPQAPPPRADNVRPAPVIVQNGGPAVPELPDVSANAPGGKPALPPQSSLVPGTSGTPGTPAPQPSVPGAPPQAQPSTPGASPQTPPNFSAVNASGQPPASAPAGQPPAAPEAGQSNVPPGQQTAAPTPGQPASPSGQPPAAPGAGQPNSSPGQQPGASAPGRPNVPPGQSGGQAAPQPLPGTPVLEDGGPIVPDVPADGDASRPQTRPLAPNAPAPPSAPGASQPAGTPPAAVRPDVSPTPLPQPLPGTPAPQPAAPGASLPAPGTSGTPAPQTPPAPGSGQPNIPPGRPGGQPTPQPLPGAPGAEGGGSPVPDIPAGGDTPQPQTRPSASNAPASPSTPGASQPAGAPPAAAQPNTPAPQAPVPQAPTPPPAYPGTYPRPGTATYPRPTPQQSYAHAASDHAADPAGASNPGSANTANTANAANTASGAPAAPSPQIKPEMLLREALGQMVGAAEIPLGNPATDAARLAPGNKMPEAVLDKAAAILLRGAGLTPDPETTEAAKALVVNNVPVDRDSVQALLTAAAGIDDAGEREAALRAAARLLSKDIPLSPPLVSGMADVVSRRATAHQLMDAAMQALAPDASMPTGEAEPLMAGARELLDMLHVDLGRADAPAALERALSTFGREALGQALALVETSAQAVLENNPQLQKIDQALTAILSRLRPEMEQAAQPPVAATPAAPVTPPIAAEAPVAPAPVAPPPRTPTPAAAPQTPPAAVPQANIEELIPSAAAPVPAEQPVQPQTQAPVPPPPPAHSGRPINAYLNAPKALPIEEMLKKLPPMPKVVSLGTTPAAIPPMMLPGNIANMANSANPAGGAQGSAPPLSTLPPSTAQQIPAQTLPQILPHMPGAQPNIPQGIPPGASEAAEPLDPEQIFRQAEALRRQSGVMNKLGSLFQIPGLNRQELELLRPGGFLDSFLSSAADRSDAVQVKADAEKLLRELMSADPRTAERALREIPQRDSAVLRETASRLTQMESDAVRADPLMNKLSDAATSLRDLGRQLLAVKAENLALQDRNPGVMLAEVPFKLNDDAGDGRMQMFYRRGKKKGDGWSSRVILDLNTTRMGPVLGDMRFFGQDMTLNMFVDKQEAAEYLSTSAEELAENLSAKGFRVKMKFMVLPPPPPPPTLDAERPVISVEGEAEPQSAGIKRTPGRLDIEL